MTKKFAAGLALGILGTILVAIAIWLTVAYTGAYNVAASDPHADAVRWTLDTTMRRSIARRSGEVELPEALRTNSWPKARASMPRAASIATALRAVIRPTGRGGCGPSRRAWWKQPRSGGPRRFTGSSRTASR